MSDESPTRPGIFVERASSGSAGGNIAVLVEGDGSDGVMGVEGRSGGLGRFVVGEGGAGKGEVGESGALIRLSQGEALAFAVEDKLGVVDKWHAVGGGEFFGALANEVDVRAPVEHQARGLNGIAQALDAGDSAGAHRASIHEESIKLDAPVAGEKAAAPGVEGGVVFEFGDGGFDGVGGGGCRVRAANSRSAARQRRLARGPRACRRGWPRLRRER